MFPLFWLSLAILVILKNSRNMWWVYLVTVMWINPDVRVGTVSLMSFLHIFIMINATRISKKDIGQKAQVMSVLKRVIVYMAFINLVFLPFHTCSLIDNVMSMKSQIIVWPFLYSLLFYPPCRKSDFLIVGLSLLLLCVYGFFSYFTTENPYMAFLSEYMSEDVHIMERVERSMKDARGVLGGRITGTSLYTIQYGIMLVLLMYSILGNITKKYSLFFMIIMLCAFINIYLTGSRGPLLALVLGVVFYYSKSLSLKKQTAIIILISIVIIIFSSFFSKYVGSLVTDGNEHGSNISDRSIQFYGALAIVSGDIMSLLFGMGPFYVDNYILNYGPHPLAAGFESTHVYGIVTYGIIGLILIFVGTEIVMLKAANKLKRKNYLNNDSYYLIISLVLTNFVYNVMVGGVYENLYKFIFIMFVLANNLENPYSTFNGQSLKKGGT